MELFSAYKYVDEAFVAVDSVETITKPSKELEKSPELPYKRVSFFLGIQGEMYKKDNILIHQEKYVNKLLERFKMKETASRVALPAGNQIYSEDKTEKILDKPHRETVGALQYLAVAARFYMASTESHLSRYLSR